MMGVYLQQHLDLRLREDPTHSAEYGHFSAVNIDLQKIGKHGFVCKNSYRD